MAIKFGLMETMDVLPILSTRVTGLNYSMAIIPTVLIPLTGLTVLLSSLATVIASWFGIQLKMEGPKQLLEVLLTKKVILSAIVLNFAMMGAYKGYLYTKTLPVPLFWIQYNSTKNAQTSIDNYENSPERIQTFNLSGVEKKISTVGELKEIWTQKFPKGTFRSGAISGHSLFLGSDDHFVHELNLETGTVKRNFYIGTQVTPRPVIYQSRLFVGEGNHDTHHARIYSFDLKTGKFSGAFQTKGHTETQPIIKTYKDETLMFLTAGKDGIYAISPDTLKEKWHAIDGHIDATVSIEDGIVYSGTGREKGNNQDRIFAVTYEFSSGKIIWKKELPLSNWMHPIIGKKDVCYALGEIYFKSNIGFLHCLDKKTGLADFSIPFESPLIGKPLIIKNKENGNEIAVVSSFNGEVCAINLQSQTKIWCQQTGNKKTTYAFSSVNFDAKRNLLWYASVDNGFYGFHFENGEIAAHWQPTNSAYKKWNETDASVTIKDNSFFISDMEGVIRRLDILN